MYVDDAVAVASFELRAVRAAVVPQGALVDVAITHAGRKRLAALTKKNVGRYLAVIANERLVAAALILESLDNPGLIRVMATVSPEEATRMEAVTSAVGGAGPPVTADDNAEWERQEATAMIRSFSAYAAPYPLWGAWKQVAVHIGPVGYRIGAVPAGETTLTGKVRYWNVIWKEKLWEDEVEFITGNAAAEVRVQFQGTPFGSAVVGAIDP